MALTFGLVLDVDAPFQELTDRAHEAERLGFATVYVPDHSRPWRHDPFPRGIWFDGWTVLTALAAATDAIRVGTLVTNPVLRPPALLVREALAVDHVSNGRLQLGIGTGIAPFDHEAAGTPYWPIGERLARYREYMQFVDRALRSNGERFEYRGDYFTGVMAGLPAPVQQPRPPLCAAGASAVVRDVAVTTCDAWNTHGAFGVAADELPEHLGALNHDVSRRCEETGRDPATLRRSVLLFDSLSPWSRRGRLGELHDSMERLGFEELVVFWPWDDAARAVFENDVPLVVAATDDGRGDGGID